ncbi:MAG: hypothetical protein L0Y73_06910 [Candidatus Aminicenantes bacterium]|nr:hypothetical protein [Candidatus Aminicenantes bacterium]
MGTEFEILRKIQTGSISEHELLDIYEQHKQTYNVLFHLVQHPRFPERFSLNIIPSLFSMDLVRVIKNTRTRPYIRQRAELEFTFRYTKLPLGEKSSYMKIAPLSLLNYFVEEKNGRILEVILHNSFCTEELVLKFINRKSQRYEFYQALDTTEWYKRPLVAESISYDEQAPIKIMMQIIPYLNLNRLRDIYKDRKTHRSIRKAILDYTRQKKYEEKDDFE